MDLAATQQPLGELQETLDKLEVERQDIDNAAKVDIEPRLKEIGDMIRELQSRVEDLEFRSPKAKPISYITPNTSLSGVIERVNHLITYLNEGIRNG